ncbi:zeta toxin family protein [Hymenobacter caeli]|uniref:ABC-type ATPase n=1 Tax=Hymenobacter caeli TaxID=2735894 RepID=A0ABX2FTE2_9BACT|nr:zeta toxin family protein [Hymenobacter caeli]NRT20276.1 putative ABC-type ATPase [Hymenobacter caeli]
MPDKNLYIIAGCNGAGKTTASFTILPEVLDCREFVNADEIARGLSPFQPEKVAFEAGRIMLHRVDELFARGETFAVETTLATKIYQQNIVAAQQQGYTVILLFFWLNDVELAQERVKTRISEGGHSIEPDVITRRYQQGIINLFDNYLPLVDEALIFDNSAGEHVLLAEKISSNLHIVNNHIYSQLRTYYENRTRN